MDVGAQTRRLETVANIYKVWRQLTPIQREYFYNGIGSRVVFLRWARLPAWVSKIFERAGRVHDLGYYLGGSDEDRAAVDSEFSAISLTDSYEATRSFAKRFFLRACSRLALNAVRSGGEFAWEMREKPLTREELLEKHKDGLAKAEAEHRARLTSVVDKTEAAARRLREHIERQR